MNKLQGITTVHLRILSIPFGHADKMDRTREYFDSRTDIGNYDKAVYHNHNPQRLYGCVVDTHSLPDGVYSLAQVTFFPQDGWLLEEIKEDRVYASSGTGELDYVVEDGHISLWPFVEISLVTPYTERSDKSSLPANWKARAKLVNTWKGQTISNFTGG